jgi:methionine-gamma-lyase
MEQERPQGFATRAVHAGEAPDSATGALNPPLYQTSTYAFSSLADKQAILGGEREGYFYTRDGNPTTRTYERKHAALEGTEDALLGASGMGVIAATIFSVMSAGCHLLASDALYSVAEAFFQQDLPRLGIGVTRVDVADLDGVRAAIHPSTIALYVESLSNPTLKVADLPALAEIAHERGVLLIVDNTFASPWLLRPAAHGADLVIHSATKYLSGHGDIVAGVVAGRAELIARARTMLSHLGAPISPFNAWLLLRGVKTLELRMERHCRNALGLATYLSARPEVTRVYYPGLPDHPGHAIAARLLEGGFGGMLAFELAAGAEAAQHFADALHLCAHAVSLGEVNTLVWPWSGCSLVRVSTGIETLADIIADFEQALARIG